MLLFDSHFHIIDPHFPLAPNDGFLPAPFTYQHYQRRTAGFGLAGGAVVAGSFQAFDQGYLKAALVELGPAFVGVTQLPADTTDEEIKALDDAGIRGVRFNVRRGGSERLDRMEAFARRVHDLVHWHVELYVDARELDPLADLVLALPAVSIDHLGLSRAGFPTLLRLAERGVKVKATGFGRVDLDLSQALRDLWSANPSCLMFGTDLPSTRAPRPFSEADVQLVMDTFDEVQARRILHDNAVDFYRPGSQPAIMNVTSPSA
jgi:predicted TIM-barrel fold metal-dependent hydrolase